MRLTWQHARGIAAYGIGPVLGLATGPLLARALSPEGRGELAALAEPLTLAVVLGVSGLPAAATFFVARGFDPGAVLRSCRRLAVLPMAVTSGLLVLLGIRLVDRIDISALEVACVWLLLLPMVFIALKRGVVHGLGHWSKLDRERFTASSLRFAFVLVIVVAGLAQAWIVAAGSLGAFCIAGLWLRGGVSASPPETPQLSARDRRALARYAVGASLGSFAIAANNRVDQVLMALVSSPGQLGYYAVAVTIAEVPNVFATLAARDTQQRVGSGASIRRTAADVAPYFAAIGLSVLTVVLAAPWVVPAVFGADFTASVQPTIVLAVSSLLYAMSLQTMALAEGSGRPALTVVVSGAALTTTLGGFVALGSGAVDAVAAAWISLASNVLGLGAGLIIAGVAMRHRSVLQGSLEEDE